MAESEGTGDRAPSQDPGSYGSEVSTPQRDHQVYVGYAAEHGDAVLDRRRKRGPGTRGVSTLTPEQLEKKRKNDRDAQRLIRQRNKENVETLQRRVQELESQPAYREVQAAIRAKEAAEQETANLKQQLRAIIDTLQPLVGSGPDKAYVSPAQTYVHSLQNPGLVGASSTSTPPNAGPIHSAPYTSTPTSITSPSVASFDGTAQSTQPSVEHINTQLQHQRQVLRQGLNLGPERLDLDFLVSSKHAIPKMPSGLHAIQDNAQYRPLQMKQDWPAVSNENGLASQHNGPWSPSTRDAAGQPIQRGTSTQPNYWIPVQNCKATCPLDSLLLDFLRERRQRAADGLPAQDVVGPRHPSVSSLLNPSQSVFSHPLSKVFTDILATFPDISTLPERVAVLYVMFHFMRWQIALDQDNYEHLPRWMIPLPSQTAIPHPAWIDHLPYPLMREKLIQAHSRNQGLSFENFFIPFTTTLRLNWPYEDADTLLETTETGELMINPVFERHLRNLSNWRLGEAFAKAFPFLRDTCSIDSTLPATPGSR
ncbi:hypothetical protein S7711_03138 [Stachybotrys chartarum IBT 7711]|uniref:BZIP domain-containing protein n=1 Tax=Stachybotrys chartarum (strain CBS 109288 / IBT 7711) TaxID=1280523 RepID=A0A084AWH5_STACB|nr:hypothetical protein S7711_03138 [Stachybotrys chartarum IBT 7711]